MIARMVRLKISGRSLGLPVPAGTGRLPLIRRPLAAHPSAESDAERAVDALQPDDCPDNDVAGDQHCDGGDEHREDEPPKPDVASSTHQCMGC